VHGSWGESENNRRAKYYRLTSAGRHRLGEEKQNWAQIVTAIRKVLEAV
jgi:DNA-binding PadR family transcriptional regulator